MARPYADCASYLTTRRSWFCAGTNDDDIPKPDDAADALALAICQLHGGKLHDLQ